MITYHKAQILRQHILFRDLTLKELLLFADKTKEKIFPAKTAIINQSQPADAVYFIYKGLVKIYILNKEGKIIPIRIKEPQYIVGELNLFDNESTATVETLQETHTLVISKEDCKKLIMEKPRFAFNFLRMITEKLHAANNQANDYFSLRLKERTLEILKTLASHFPDNIISLSQEELAFIIGASRARVTETLDELACLKIISLARRKIVLHRTDFSHLDTDN